MLTVNKAIVDTDVAENVWLSAPTAAFAIETKCNML